MKPIQPPIPAGDPFPVKLGEFYRAIEAGDHKYVEALLKEYPRVLRETIDAANGDSPVHKASRKGHVMVARILLHDDDSIRGNFAGNTPLHEAVIAGNVEMVRFLVEEEDNDVNLHNRHGDTVFHIAHKLHNPELIEILKPHVNPDILDELSPEKKLQEEMQKSQAEFAIREEKRLARIVAKKIRHTVDKIIRQIEEEEEAPKKAQEALQKAQEQRSEDILAVATAKVNKDVNKGLMKVVKKITDEITKKQEAEKDEERRLEQIKKSDLEREQRIKEQEELQQKIDKQNAELESLVISNREAYEAQRYAKIKDEFSAGFLEQMAEILKVEIKFRGRDGKQEFDANATDRFGNTIMHHFSNFQSNEMIQDGLFYATKDPRLKIDLNRKNKTDTKGISDGATPLLRACATGSLEVAKVLIDIPQVDLRAVDNNGNTAVHRCSRYSGPESTAIVSKIVEKEGIAVFHQKNKNQLTPALLCCDKGGNVQILKMFLEAKVDGKPLLDVNAVVDMSGGSLLHHACFLGNVEAAKLLIEHGADVGLVNAMGQTPFRSFTAGSTKMDKSEADKFSLEFKAALKKKIEEKQEKEREKLPATINKDLPPPPNTSSRKGEDSENSKLRTALPLRSAETEKYNS